MTTGTLTTHTDTAVRDAVMRQLEWDAGVDPRGIGVTARNGIVTLTGDIDSYAGKLAAERAARRVHRVRGVANDLEVRLRVERMDTDLASDAVRAIDLRATVPESVQVVVHNGYVTLTGRAPTLFHCAEAEKAIRHLRGIKGIRNRIQVVRTPTARELRGDIGDALHRDADLRGREIHVTVDDGHVTLTGEVATWSDRESAERAVMHAQGVTGVDNRLVVAADGDVDEIC